MRAIRNRLSWLVAGWLAVQLTTLFGAPAALYAAAGQKGAARCVCPLGHSEGQCPMHSHEGGRRESDAREADPSKCAIKGALGQTDALLLTVIMAAIVPSRVALDGAPLPVASVAVTGTRLVYLFAPPDPPPPRA